MKIGIIGGSIAGCFSSVELMRLGHEVTIFERSNTPLEDRGIGFAMTQGIVDDCIWRNLLDHDVPQIMINQLNVIVKDDVCDKIEGRCLNVNPLSAVGFSWDHLYAQIAKRCSNYRFGSEVTDLLALEQDTRLQINYTDWLAFDLVIACDGFHSFARSYVTNHYQPHFLGYIVWRGVTTLQKQNQQKFTQNGSFQYLCPQGHFVAHPIPSKLNDTNKTPRINWLFYETMHSIGKHPDERLHIEALANLYLPKTCLELIAQTSSISMEVVRDFNLKNYVNDRLIILGDSAASQPPVTGSGAGKAIQSAIELAKCLGSSSDIDSALKNWEALQKQRNTALFEMGRTLSKALITDPPDWSHMSKESYLELRQKIYGSAMTYHKM